MQIPEILPDHTRLSASGAERWMNCVGSQALAERLGLTGTESEYAAEGTAAHELAANCLEDGTDAWEHQGELVYEHEVDEEMANAVQVYLDHCRKLIRKYPNAEVLIEKRIDNKSIHPDFGGTSDFTLITDDWIIVVDYKHGVGIAKDARGNPQIRYYAVGTLYKIPEGSKRRKIKHIRYTIVQPRAFHPDGIVRSEHTTPQELVEWFARELLPAMKAVDEPDAPLKAGEHCRFCPAILGCPIMQAMFQAAKKAKPSDAQVHSDTKLGLEYEMIPVVRMYLKALQDEGYARASKGKKVPGGKMVQGKADRVWKKGAVAKLKAKYGAKALQEQKTISPAQAEKLTGGAVFVAAEAYKPDGKLSFVPLTHKAHAVSVEAPSEKFAGIKRGSEKPDVIEEEVVW